MTLRKSVIKATLTGPNLELKKAPDMLKKGHCSLEGLGQRMHEQQSLQVIILTGERVTWGMLAIPWEKQNNKLHRKLLPNAS